MWLRDVCLDPTTRGCGWRLVASAAMARAGCVLRGRVALLWVAVMTNSDRLRALAVMADLSLSNLEGLRDKLIHMVLEVELQIERVRPGYMIDRRIGNSTPINLSLDRRAGHD